MISFELLFPVSVVAGFVGAMSGMGGGKVHKNNPSRLNAETDKGRNSELQLEMNVLVGYILQTGVLFSMTLIAAGLLLTWIYTGKLMLNYRITGANHFEFSVNEIRLALQGAFGPHLLVNLGITVLMLTPFIRVTASTVYFVGMLKNWKYALFTSFVLAVLTYSLFLR